MGTRGRKSKAELTIVGQAAGEIVSLHRPEPPDELTPEQAEEWRSIVDQNPADWFSRDTWSLLAQYCRHIVMARRIGQLIANADREQEVEIEEYDRLGRMLTRESAALCMLATKMRIAQQSTRNHRGNKSPSGRKPWEA